MATVLVTSALPLRAAEEQELQEPANWYEQLKRPTSWLTLGGDLRLRQTYLKNPFDFNDNLRDNRNFVRIRTRLWGQAGPFFGDDALQEPNGLTVYTRLNYEPRYIFQWNGRWGDTPMWDEVIVDNLYADWQRIGGMPFSVRVGRQDILYDRGFVLLDGSPLDGSRSIYSDAIKATIHLDAIKGKIDILGIDNRGDEDRLTPFGNKDLLLNEYETRIYGAHFSTKIIDGQQLGAYYFNKKDKRHRSANAALANERRVHTLGVPVSGKLGDGWDYYAEFAYQWGEEAAADRQGWGFSSDLGYTFTDAEWKPRFHAGFEYMSGDDRTTNTFEAWDPVMSRWPQCSELLGYRWAVETRMPFNWTNLHRYTVGAGLQPHKIVKLSFDYSFLCVDERQAIRLGSTRGPLYVAKALFKFTPQLSGHLWFEYFKPRSYYVSPGKDGSLFFRWELGYTF